MVESSFNDCSGTEGAPELQREHLEPRHCWFTTDQVPGELEMTEFKRRARLRQAMWRSERGLPYGSHRAGRPPIERPNGSKLDAGLRDAGLNFLSDTIRAAVAHRLANPEDHQTLDRARLELDLLSSMPMCFNLFGECHDNPVRCGAAWSSLAPDAPPGDTRVRFEWSPGRRDERYLGDRTAFDAALVSTSDAGVAVVGIETKYHEHTTSEPPVQRQRYFDVAAGSGAFRPGWESAVLGTPLQQIWRDHLLLLAMLQSGEYKWGRYILVYPAANVSFANAASRYLDILTDDTTFQARTIEALLDARVLHDPAAATAFRDRYLWDGVR